MEWVETTGKSVDEARNAALDQLGVGMDDAEIEVLEEPRPGLFGRVRGEARLRARVKPAQVRPKNDQRRRSRGRGSSKNDQRGGGGRSRKDGDRQTREPEESNAKDHRAAAPATDGTDDRTRQESTMTNDEHPSTDEDVSDVSPDEVAQAAVTFMEGLGNAFGTDVSVELLVEGSEIDVNVDGQNLGLLVGPGGRTLNAVQDLARVAAQRRLGDHETRLRIDVAGYRERRKVALEDFARKVAETVRTSGESRSMEPMTSADRKVVHDVLNQEEGVTTRSVGEDPDRRIVVEPA